MSRRAPSGLIAGLTWETGVLTYAGPAEFDIASVNKTAEYKPGVVVHIPGSPVPYSSVQLSYYSGGVTTVVLSDACCYSGMASIAYVPPQENFTDITSTSYAISGGDNATVWAKEGAFNNVTAWANYNAWFSSQIGTGISGAAYIGQNFGAAKNVRWFRILQANGQNTNAFGISSVKLQYSDNGSSWTDSATFDLNYELFQLCIAPVPATGHQYWRLLANANLVGTTFWCVIELEMGE